MRIEWRKKKVLSIRAVLKLMTFTLKGQILIDSFIFMFFDMISLSWLADDTTKKGS
jgi:hypothetical protein